jgi:hypothetical protein
MQSNRVLQYHLFEMIKNLRRDNVAREKVRPKIVGFAGRTKGEAFEHPKNSSKSEEVRSS